MSELTKAQHSIAVLSDTHNNLPQHVLDRLTNADEIWHLGDVSNEAVFQTIKNLEIKLHVVQGNTDPAGRWPSKLKFTRFGHRFTLQHYPFTLNDSDHGTFLHGHLHIPIDEQNATYRILSPGAITGPRQGTSASFGWLHFQPSNDWTWKRERI